MVYSTIALSWAVVLILLWALLAGQPAAQDDYRLKADAQATQIAEFQVLHPTPTSRACWMAGHC